MSYSLENYVDVAERLRLAKEMFPDFRIQSEIWFDDIEGQKVVICKAKFYRDGNDTIPATGHAWELVWGKTPFVKYSEVMNAETSAWGRCVAAAGVPVSKVATVEEVKSAKARQTPRKAPTAVELLKAKLVELGATDSESALKILASFTNEIHTSFDEIDDAKAVKLMGKIHD